MTVRYVFDTGALISAERRKPRASRFLRLAQDGRAKVVVPLAVVAEWWRGRTDIREEILASVDVVGSLVAAQAAGLALTNLRDVHAALTIDAIVMATAALNDAIVVTGDPDDFDRLLPHFPGVAVVSA